MQYTSHYNLNVPEGTDIVNPLVQDNPNWNAIDAALYANKLRVIGTATEVKTGTVHALTRSDTDIPVFRFVATADYNTGDTFTVDGVTVTARVADGTTIPNEAYKINSTVLAVLDGTILNFININGTITGPAPITVTADGVKSLSTLLNELYALIDWTKITGNSYIYFSSGDRIYRYCEQYSGAYCFNWTLVRFSECDFDNFMIGSSSRAFSWTFSTAPGTVTEISANVPTSGRTLTFYYE